MSPTPTETATTAFHLLLAAEREGLDMSAHLAACGLTRDRLPDFRERLPLRRLFELWGAVMRQLRSSGFPPRAARIPAGQMGSLLAFLCGSSPTVHEAACRLARYWPAVSDFGSFSLVEEQAGARLMLVGAPLSELGARCQSEFCLADLVNCTREATGSLWTPDAVSFAHPAPADTSEHRALFGEVSFGQPWTGFYMSQKTLSIPFLQPAPALASILEEQASLLLAARPSSATEEVCRKLCLALERGDPATIEQIAKGMGASPRTVQRRLREEGTHFQALLDERRKERSALLLRSPGHTLKEVASQLGFADVRSFHRAHLRWTGVTPKSARRSP